MLIGSARIVADGFGRSVALSSDGSRALIGAPYGDGSAGRVHVFSRTGTTWTEEAILSPSGAAPEQVFGLSVALSSDATRALVGATGDEAIGSVRAFARIDTSWVEEATLRASDGAPGDAFGWSVALTSDAARAVVGVLLDDTDDISSNTGTARVFLRTGTTWIEETTLRAVNGRGDDHMGSSVAVSSNGRVAVVGVTGDDPGRIEAAGSARVFLRTGTTWTE